MKKAITILAAMTLIFAVVITSCKEDDEEAPQSTPEWLTPYLGYYQGTFTGDDTGTWYFTISSTTFEMFVTSETDLETYSRVMTLMESGTFAFADNEVILGGTISNHSSVAGAWEVIEDGASGTFTGSKQ
jgi:hypothetical protein